MKTKIIYISGTEIFDIADIRAAFDEVRLALNLDKNTVLFGVPVDKDDAGLSSNIESKQTAEIKSIEPVEEIPVEEETPITPVISDIETPKEPITPKRRGRPRKEVIEPVIEEQEITVEVPVEEESTEEEEEEPEEEIIIEDSEEKIIPILSVLSSDDDEEPENIEDETTPVEDAEEEVIEEKSEEEIIDDIINENISNIPDSLDEETEPDLEKLLSGIKPLGEDTSANVPPAKEEVPESENVDATLELLATEYVKNQDKIASESKTASRSKISTLRSILPFKPKSQKDSNSGDLFSWGGLAANDEDFSVPGFFTKKSK